MLSVSTRKKEKEKAYDYRSTEFLFLFLVEVNIISVRASEHGPFWFSKDGLYSTNSISFKLIMNPKSYIYITRKKKKKEK